MFQAVVGTLLAFAWFHSASAGVPAVAWDRKANSQSAGLFYAPNGMSVDSAGNIYVVADVLGAPLIVKYDGNGTEQWRIQESTGIPTSLAVDAGGNVYVAAVTDGPALGTHAFLTFKYDAFGVKQWQTESHDADGRDAVAMAVSVDRWGNVYTSGQTHTLTAEPWAFLTLKYGPDGIEQWRALEIASESVSGNFPLLQTVDDNGNLTVTGTIGFYDCLTINYGPNGNERWRASCNDALTVWASPTAIVTDGSGNIYLAAQSAYVNYAGIQSAYLVIKYGPNGIEQWRRRYPAGWENTDPFAVTFDPDGNVYVTGRIWDNTVHQGRPLTIKYSSSGDLQWRQFGPYLDSLDDYPQSLVVNPKGEVQIGLPFYDDATGRTSRVFIKYARDGSELWRFTTPGVVAAGYPFVLALAPSGEALYAATQAADPADPGGIALQKIVESPTAVFSSLNPSIAGQNVTLTALVADDAPAGTIGFFEYWVGSPVWVLGCFATFPVNAGQAACTTSAMVPGTHGIMAIYNDAAGRITASTYLTQVVNPGIWVTSTTNPSASGQSVTFTATVGGNAPQGGTVDFLDGATVICRGKKLTVLNTATGNATCTSASLATGTHSITATYSGDSLNAGVTSAPLMQTVAGPTSAVTLVSSLNPSRRGQIVAFTATVTGQAPTGSLAFKDGSSTITGCAAIALAAGKATCSTAALRRGTHAITAIYSGDANNAPGTSSVLNQVVKR